MNLILINPDELKNGLILNDSRVKHINEILKLKNNETFKFGIIGEKYIYSCVYQKDVKLFFRENRKIAKSNKLKKLKVIIGLVRPIAAKRIITHLGSIGISELIFFNALLSEKSYLCSKLFKEREYEKYLIEGAMQGGITYIPKVKIFNNLREVLKNTEYEGDNTTKILLERESKNKLVDLNIQTKNTAVIIGPERGFITKEINLIKEYNFNAYNISSNILRTETATIVASAIITSKMNIK
ncbi:16S rRNA (uracil(1498)-N(3))-methyltransferase [Borrelia puertoricensis]|uniref:16S rRNA (uracil(1498)-N(3))-methyltransferase n=1 Tax=Borrelia puertoricensis TaxID=2756107 RepID=UPI001FF0E41B|nr:16S rRNA (uracil(1498)-N(3))-methyltransferase [Borrelia puertoricensis]UPA17596.1 16S rRNA (uracil(1498)-N(3))-methyltransferase [Borrelia puertoricensis]